MAKLVQTLILILLLLVAAAATTARSQTTNFSYYFSGKNPADIILQGNAHFPSETSFLRLTDDQPAQVGRALHSNPIQFWNAGGQVDFQTIFNFIITPSATSLPAAGVAFFIAPASSTIPYGSIGANLGIFGASPCIFAVEFATYVKGAASGPDYPRVGINIGTATSLNTTFVGNSIIGQQVTAYISYIADTNKIYVFVTAGSQKFEVSYVYDLTKLLEEEVKVGLSASTGFYVATHDIVSWYFFSNLGVEKPTNFSYNFNREKPADLILQGFASFPSEPKFLRLTDAQPNQVGRALYWKPIRFWSTGGRFETTVKFIIIPSDRELPGDGVAFFIAPVCSTIPGNSTGKNLGIFSPGVSNNVFAVEFTTYIDGAASELEYPQIGINIGTATSVNTTLVGNSIIGQQVTAHISYDPYTKQIKVDVNAGSRTFELSYVYDLTTLLDQYVQVGLSASTGFDFATHGIVSWSIDSSLNSAAGFQKCVM